MQNIFEKLKMSRLFANLNENEVKSALKCLDYFEKSFKKDEIMMNMGDDVTSFGIIVSGSVTVSKEDFWGNRNIIAKLKSPQMFAESYAVLFGAKSSVIVTANEPTLVVFINAKKLLSTESAACEIRSRIISNLVACLAEKNLRLNDKINNISQRTTRSKLMSFLSMQAQASNSADFQIQFNRQQLADYLSVERSAMSKELCKMRDEGILSFDKNRFVLNDDFGQIG